MAKTAIKILFVLMLYFVGMAFIYYYFRSPSIDFEKSTQIKGTILRSPQRDWTKGDHFNYFYRFKINESSKSFILEGCSYDVCDESILTLTQDDSVRIEFVPIEGEQGSVISLHSERFG